MTRTLLLALVLFAPAAAEDSCATCHGALEGNLASPAKSFPGDVHRGHGFDCVSCHGGDAASMDPEISMSRARGFRGKIARHAVPALCGGCHGDASLIHKYKPQQRVDQLIQYKTSVHGKRLAAGDTAVANCVDCHSVHDVREVKDPRSPVYPTRLPETCGRCHADKDHMANYKIPTDQFGGYRQSVHWEALAKRGDHSAPTCASCHGNHGATPPDVSSVGAVCGTCHVLIENLYKKSPHQPVFEAMGAAGCVVCHSNHEVSKPSLSMLVGETAVCGQCHDAQSAGGQTAVTMAGLLEKLRAQISSSDEILQRARLRGMEVSDAQFQQMEAGERLVKARVAVHAFHLPEVSKPVEEGLRISRGAYASGEDALKEIDQRRLGLGLSLIVIVITIAGLGLAIRSIESREAGGG